MLGDRQVMENIKFYGFAKRLVWLSKQEKHRKIFNRIIQKSRERG